MGRTGTRPCINCGQAITRGLGHKVIYCAPGCMSSDPQAPARIEAFERSCRRGGWFLAGLVILALALNILNIMSTG